MHAKQFHDQQSRRKSEQARPHECFQMVKNKASKQAQIWNFHGMSTKLGSPIQRHLMETH